MVATEVGMYRTMYFLYQTLDYLYVRQEWFENIKWEIITCISKERQYNDERQKDQRTNNGPQNTTR